MFKKLAFCPSPHARTRPQIHPAPFAQRPTTPITLSSRKARLNQSGQPGTNRLMIEESLMPEVIFTGPAGRLEGRYHPAKQKNAPIAMILHPHPQFHGTMNHQIVYQCYYAFAHRGFSVLRFNFRGVGRSQGSFDHGGRRFYLDRAARQSL
jgi:predicted alpha/beta-fold hydrolase